MTAIRPGASPGATANETASNSLYLGNGTRASVAGDVEVLRESDSIVAILRADGVERDLQDAIDADRGDQLTIGGAS